MLNRKELLERWLELKNVENKAKEERVALEEQIWIEFEQDTLPDGKLSGTMNEDEFKLTIKLNPKFKIIDEDLIPEGVDIYKNVVDEKKLSEFEGESWVEKTWNKPTFTVVRKV
jgi:hypothetical protein